MRRLSQLIEKTCIRVEISGIVQGVGFRWKTREAALALGITGWITNRPDGNVETVFQGSRSSVDEMIRWARKGPAGATVIGIKLHRQKFDEELCDFMILK